MYVLHRPDQHKGKHANTDASPTADPAKDSSQQDYTALITAARTKYNSMDQKGIWNKVDPRDAQIMALTTMVETMKGNKNPSIHGNGGTVLSVNAQDDWQNNTTNNDFIDGLARWRIKDVRPSKCFYGKTYY